MADSPDTYWFYAPALAPVTPLPDDQAHHALAVLRLDSPTPVTLFDAQGRFAPGLFRQTGKRTAEVTLTADIQTAPPPPIRLTLATAVPKGDRAEWLIEQASQLNAAAVAWLDCDRGVVKPKEGGNKIEKHQRLALENAKQCHRPLILQVHPMRKLGEILADAIQSHSKILWLEPREGTTVASALAQLPPDQQSARPSLVALIGPEGGWSEREITLLTQAVDHGQAIRVKLTPTILRIETAAAAIAAIVNSQ